MNDTYININKIAEIKGLKSTRSLRMAINNGKYIAKAVPNELLTKELCEIALDNSKNIIYIPKHFLDSNMCKKAFDYDHKLIKWIPEEFYNNDMNKYIEYIDSEEYINEQNSKYDIYSNERNDDA